MITSVLVKVNTLGKVVPYMMIDSLGDLPHYFEHVSEQCVQHFTKIVKSDIPQEKWDHCLGGSQGASIFGHAVMQSKFNQKNPIYNLDSAIHRKYNAFANFLAKGQPILINKAGGYCPFIDGEHELVYQKPYSLDEEKHQNIVIKKQTKYINLENDPILESHTISYLSKIDPNYSHITNLRSFDIEELIEAFIRFKDNGGTTVYIYTTGTDIEQMYNYSEAICRAQLAHVEFEFNAGYRSEFDGVIDVLEREQIKVKTLLTKQSH